MAYKLIDQRSYELGGLEYGRASASSFGTVILTDSYTYTGRASEGLSVSQKALFDGLRGLLQVISGTVTITIQKDVGFISDQRIDLEIPSSYKPVALTRWNIDDTDVKLVGFRMVDSGVYVDLENTSSQAEKQVEIMAAVLCMRSIGVG